MKIFDNIGCEFSYNFTDNSFTLLGPLPGYSALSIDNKGCSVPYLARNIDGKNIEYELGVGYLEQVNNKLILKDKKISVSSNNNKDVDFTKNGNKQFYVFVHNTSYDNAFNNVFIENQDFIIESRKGVYIVDVSSGYVIGSLPDPRSCEAVELEFKTLGHTGSLKLNYQHFEIILNTNSYTKLVSTGKEWIELKDASTTTPLSSLSVSENDNSFSALSDPAGTDRSLQFNNNDTFDGSSLYQGNNNKLLFGSSTEALAKHIIPSSGNYNLVFNQTKDGSDFIVYGTGNAPGYPSKNLYFSYDGKLGINMPSGVNTGSIVKPSTILHVFNTLCREGIRLENRANCYPADITLYDNPFSYPRPDGTGIARIVFAGKDSASNKVDFAKIETKIKSSSSKLGQLDISVSDGALSKTTFSSSANKTILQTDSALVDINASSVSLSGTSVNLKGSNIGVNASNVNISGITTLHTKLKLPFISTTNALLSVNSNYEIIATTGFKIPSLSTEQESLLSARPDGTVSASIPKNSLWPYETGDKIGGKDLKWDRYPYRSATVCFNKATKEIQIENSPLEEYSIGDQIAILNLNDYTTIYRVISSLVIEENFITGIIIDQDILITDSNANLRVYSVSKGGVLTNTIFTSGVISDATNVVLSSRPGTNTVFNSKRKNIDFTVYGSERAPAINVIANVGVGQTAAGIYSKYATQSDVPPFPAKINSVGIGSANSSINNTANFFDAASTDWLAKVTSVGYNGKKSYYGTFDQNGNVYEWIEDDIKIASYSSHQYVCGGSWRTKENNALRGYISTPRYSGLDDIGFRVCSKAGYTNSLELLMDLDFVGVGNINNPPDSGFLYTESWTNRFDDSNDQPTPLQKNNLGSVSYPFRMSKNEITNQQYSIFLNAVATGLSTITGLYKPEMSSNIVGGINRIGSGVPSSPYNYIVKSNMEDKPVVFIDYISSIRYINWLSQGAPTGTNVPDNVTEFGSYIIENGPGNVEQITKNRDQNYWLPTLNEWHKSAYYTAQDTNKETPYSAVTIRKDTPFEFGKFEPYESGTGVLASLSVSGYIYSDYIKINSLNITDTDRSYTTNLNPIESVIAVSGTTYLVNQGTIGEDIAIAKAMFSHDKTTLFQPLLVTTGNVSSKDSGNGVLITSSGINYVTSGVVVDGGLFPGPDGGYLFKDPDGSDVISSFGSLKAVKVMTTDEDNISRTNFFPILTHTIPYDIIYNGEEGYLTSSSGWFTAAKEFDLIEAETTQLVCVGRGISNSGERSPLLYSDRILIGPAIDSFKGSLLTHGGVQSAYWQPDEFLRAPGAVWNRYKKRAIELFPDNDKLIQFVSLDEADGGTGTVIAPEILQEFGINDTIAIYNQAREVVYVKIANLGLIDSRDQSVDTNFFVDGDDVQLKVMVCPSIPASFIKNSALPVASGNPNAGKYVAYAFSVQKGAYLDMTIEPEATTTFACKPEDIGTSEYKFKPSTINTISIRPGIYTTFNKLAEDIDFIIYGHRPTLFTRYENSWFDKDVHGVPTGLTPAFRVHTKLDNSFIGSLSSGILRDTIGENNATATGVLPDLNPKITINANNPYIITSLPNVTRGVILPESSPVANLAKEKTYGMVIPETGVLINAGSNLSNYADLTISGVTYTDSLITKDVILGPLWTGEIPIPYELSLTQKIYAPNYPLTINNLGQIVSLIPPPAPEAPSAPTNLTAEPKNNGIILTWNMPEDDGGEPIIGYIVEVSVNGTTWNDSIVQDIDSLTKLPVVANKNTIRILNNPDVVNNTEYSFRVKAYNSVGVGSISDTASTTPLNSLGPVAPRNVVIEIGENSSDIRVSNNIVLTWSAPTEGPTPQEYVVQKWVYNTLNNTDLKNAIWESVANSPVNALSDTEIQITGLDTKPLIYFSVQSKTSDGLLSSRSIYASLGTDPDPRPLGSRPTIVDANQYNFGSVIFVGSCS